LVRLLKVIEAAGKDGISTKKLCEQVFKNRNFGMCVINRAYDEGFISDMVRVSMLIIKSINYFSEKDKPLVFYFNPSASFVLYIVKERKHYCDQKQTCADNVSIDPYDQISAAIRNIVVCTFYFCQSN